jgi:hypothetical protein
VRMTAPFGMCVFSFSPETLNFVSTGRYWPKGQ